LGKSDRPTRVLPLWDGQNGFVMYVLPKTLRERAAWWLAKNNPPQQNSLRKLRWKKRRCSMPGPQELLIILAIAIILFGAKKVPELARGIAQSIREIRSATKDE